MKTKKIYLAILITTLISLNSIHAIGFGFHTFETRTSPEFSKGIFPTSLLYQFDFPVPNIISGRATEVNFRIDNGLDFRTLKQAPEDGQPFITMSNMQEHNYPKDYLTFYNEMNLVFGQGFFQSLSPEKDLLKLWATLDIRFENAYERLSYLVSSKEMEGLFQITPKTEHKDAVLRFPDCIWTGQPELIGDRSTTNISISLGFDINYMEDKITRKNGIKYSFWTRLNPAWFDFLEDDTQDFLLIWNKLDIAYTPFAIKMKGSRNTTWFSLIIENNLTYRYITGSKIPYYIQGGNIFGATTLNTSHVLTNRTTLALYGPQINSYDCYPKISGFLDIGYSVGNLLNATNPNTYSDLIMSTGFRADFIILNIAEFYYEIGYIFNNVLNISPSMITRFGFTFGI